MRSHSESGGFPIQAYSYYEYAVALQSDDLYSAMLYAEYALELSNLDLYFKERKTPSFFNFDVKNKTAWMFIWGILLGYLLCFVTKRSVSEKRQPMRTKKYIKLRD